MPVIAIVNRKGGSGKSTLATHLAAYFAHKQLPALLGDADFQQSAHAWLRQRDKQSFAPDAPKIAGWSVDPRNILRAPSGVTHVLLDTPGGLKGYDLLRVVMLADAVLMPVQHSLFDRESAADCYAELLAHPRVARGRCKIAAVGMRVDGRTKSEAALRQWAEGLQLPFLGALRETQTYVRCLEHGLTIFDMPAAKVEADLAQWQPILQWLAPMLEVTPASIEAKPARRPTRPVLPPGSSPSGRLAPVALTPHAELLAARTAPAAFDALPPSTAEADNAPPPVAPVEREIVTARKADAEAPKNHQIHRLVPVSPEEELDSRFGGFTTRIGRWLELLSLKRAR
jgi:chromosome partitioning protein